MKNLALTLLLFAAGTAFASTDRVLDGKTITAGANVVTLPLATDTLVGKATTDTFTNKTYDAAGTGNVLSNIVNTNISSSAAIAYSKLATLTSANIIVGNGSNVATSVAVTGDISLTNAGVTAYSGTVPASKGGTGQTSLTLNNVLLGNGTSAVQFVAPGTSGNVLTSNGTTWSSTAPASGAPSIVGSTGTPTAITAGGGVTFSGTNYSNTNFITGSGGAVTVTANPQITAATSVGQMLHLIGQSNSNTVTFSDGTGLSLNGTWVAGLQSVLNLEWDGTVWVETSRR